MDENKGDARDPLTLGPLCRGGGVTAKARSKITSVLATAEEIQAMATSIPGSHERKPNNHQDLLSLSPFLLLALSLPPPFLPPTTSPHTVPSSSRLSPHRPSSQHPSTLLPSYTPGHPPSLPPASFLPSLVPRLSPAASSSSQQGRPHVYQVPKTLLILASLPRSSPKLPQVRPDP